MKTLTVETKALNNKLQKMMEQLVLANNNRRTGNKCQAGEKDNRQICYGYGMTSY